MNYQGLNIIEKTTLKGQVEVGNGSIYVHTDNMYGFLFQIMSFDEALESCIHIAKSRINKTIKESLNENN